MVKALINISPHANRVLNIVKAKYDLKDKSQAIEKVAEEYECRLLKHALRPEVAKEILYKERHGKFVNWDKFRKSLE